MSRFAPRAFRSPALQWLAAVAQGWAEQPAEWRPLVHHDATGRWVEPLVVNEHSEVWLQGWPVGEHVELHDHGGASGALCVVSGELAETYAAEPDAARLRRRRLRTGGVSAFGPDLEVVQLLAAEAAAAGRSGPALTLVLWLGPEGWLVEGHGRTPARPQWPLHA